MLAGEMGSQLACGPDEIRTVDCPGHASLKGASESVLFATGVADFPGRGLAFGRLAAGGVEKDERANPEGPPARHVS